jgi:prepilin-type N-terminal cleavage/methylation domain-containing protein
MPLLWRRAFTITEVIVVIGIVAVILLLAWPAFNSALTKRDLTRTMNNGRDLYLAAFAMATDGAAKSNPDLAWPGDYPTNSLIEYCDKLVRNQYVAPADLQRILSAPGATCTVTMSGPPSLLLLSGPTAFKVYKVRAADPSNTIFAASSNYIYATPLNADAKPFGDAGIVVVHKSGDASLFGKNQATPDGFENNPAKFQSAVGIGKLPGATDGVLIPGDGDAALASPR